LTDSQIKLTLFHGLQKGVEPDSSPLLAPLQERKQLPKDKD